MAANDFPGARYLKEMFDVWTILSKRRKERWMVTGNN